MSRVRSGSFLVLVTVAVLGFVTACGDDDEGAASDAGDRAAFSPGTTCGAALVLRGALELDVPVSRTGVACATQTSFERGIDAGFLFVDGPLEHVDLAIDDVRMGETGRDFAAHVEVVHQDGREWSAHDCSAEISEHEHVGPGELGWERYRVAGTVTCEPTSDAGPALEIEALRFVATIPWG